MKLEGMTTWAAAAMLGIATLAMTPAGAALAEAPSGMGAPSDSERLAPGDGRFVFDGWSGPALRVWTHAPENVGPATPIVIVMHGRGRDADRYRDEWRDLADQHGFILAVPEFDAERFPGANAYNHGYFRDKQGALRPRPLWSFSAIEPLFDDLKRRSGSQVEGYGLYGHSAGAQFVHRFVLLTPEARYRVAIAANAGSYAFPDLDQAYPFGLEGAPVDEAGLEAALQKPLVLLLGTADTDPAHPSLPHGQNADAQGPHRLARGQAFHAAGQAGAERSGVKFGWRVAYAPGIAHDNGGMSGFAAPILAGQAQ
ncbi:hypothetical protein [Brevundimonas naejangsanensis]|uniref:hypothetical protein n=1 Tax=Brevundimonas naejangsanensis TaxID=588932 RepID=UPI00040BEB58|nr:hypothetical protein [Brevundimonas naejangsanensis]